MRVSLNNGLLYLFQVAIIFFQQRILTGMVGCTFLNTDRCIKFHLRYKTVRSSSSPFGSVTLHEIVN